MRLICKIRFLWWLFGCINIINSSYSPFIFTPASLFIPQGWACPGTVQWTWCDLGSLNWTAESLDLSPSEHLWETLEQGFFIVGIHFQAKMTPLLEASNLLVSYSAEHIWHLEKSMAWQTVVLQRVGGEVGVGFIPWFLYYFAHCMYTNIAVWPHSPLQVISSTLLKSQSLKAEGDCKGWYLIINTNYHPMRE